MGELERQEGRLDRARELLERSLAIFDKPSKSTNPDDADFARVLRKAGRMADAERIESTASKRPADGSDAERH